MSEWQGKSALVSGAGSGIGRATATMLATSGCRTVFADIDEAAAQEGADACGAKAARLDVTDEAAWSALIDRIVAEQGGLDYLVNSAGINPVGSIIDASYEDWRRTFAVNVDGMFLGCKHAMRAMVARGQGGAIVNVSSPQAERTAPTLVAYGASKAASLNLTRSVALFGADKGVRCNAVLPGAVHTSMTERFLQTVPDYAEGVRQVAAMHPMNRMAQAQEVASAICFLLGSPSSFVTGAALPVDGGFLAS